MPDPNALQKGAPVSKNWTQFNALLAKVGLIERKLQRATEHIAQLELRRDIWGGGNSGVPSWRGEWRKYKPGIFGPDGKPVFEEYAKGDMVIRGGEIVDDPDKLPLIIDGTLAGTWIAQGEVNHGEEPGSPSSDEIVSGELAWKLVARFASPSVVARKGVRRAAIAATATDAALSIGGDASGGSVVVSLNAAAGKAISLRQITVCQNNVKRKMIVLASEPFD